MMKIWNIVVRIHCIFFGTMCFTVLLNFHRVYEDLNETFLFTTVLLPLTYVFYSYGFRGRGNYWRNKEPTQRQIEFASDLGIVCHNGMSRGELSDKISEIAGQ